MMARQVNTIITLKGKKLTNEVYCVKAFALSHNTFYEGSRNYNVRGKDYEVM